MVKPEAAGVHCSKLTDDQILSKHIGLNEGDDQVHAFIPHKHESWTQLSPKAAVQRYTSVLAKANGFIFEPAFPGTEANLMGRSALMEMCSAWVGFPDGKPEEDEVVVIVPKVLKALRKIPQSTISSQHTLEYDEQGEPCGVVQNATYWALALTRYFALAIVNKESLGVRGLFLSHGDRAYDKLCELVGPNAAYSHSTVYGDRDPERRLIEEVAETTFSACGAMRESAHAEIQNVVRTRVLRRCAEAWVSELPELAKHTLEEVQTSLLDFDTITRGTEITDNMVREPMLLWLELDVGCIQAPLVSYATSNIKKISQQYRNPDLTADSRQVVQLARQLAGVKTVTSTKKDGGSDKAAESTAAAPAAKCNKKGLKNKPLPAPTKAAPTSLNPKAKEFSPIGEPPGFADKKGKGKSKGMGKHGKGHAPHGQQPRSSWEAVSPTSHQGYINWKLKPDVAASSGGGQ